MTEFNIIFHEREIGDNFNNFPPVGTKKQIALDPDKVANWIPFEAFGLSFSHGENAYDCNWWACAPSGGYCIVTIEQMKNTHVIYEGETLAIDSRFAAKNGIKHGKVISSEGEFWQIFRGNAEFMLQDINSQLNAPNCVQETESQPNGK